MFSVAMANPVFSIVSLRGNGYSLLDQDFDIVSVRGENRNDCGYWGCGAASRNIVDLGNGDFESLLSG